MPGDGLGALAIRMRLLAESLDGFAYAIEVGSWQEVGRLEALLRTTREEVQELTAMIEDECVEWQGHGPGDNEDVANRDVG